ncbi:MAG: class I SAM-dependent methyltransferase [Rhodospirillaceae bacterium]|nr:class I SAM-dependent methyltransferase [Rhodospirillaceae bacterium]MBT4220605.1 class I SAM-dependent methyltransferase [Rhodospirillaceae bacterium]MBT4464614.1 class I SAM-dependent methyltransferase [Rhodospirillaceae bacterium]MBT5013565.1 class I SAM-dependent methyltransferase [Rhodospirillaceae bacterium]MBT7355435.1 class I SAM-dependent methyltransferase [Rhodospirillaceae bacterium]
MGVYEKHILPRILHLVMRSRDLARLRAELVPQARGRVLEVGLGSGLNLPFYGAGVDAVTGLDASPELLSIAEKNNVGTSFNLDFVARGAEDIPFDDKSFDTVLTTWTMCSIGDVGAALKEMRRVLKPGGELLFIEHGRSPDPKVQAWQDRLDGLWGRCAGGCHLNRDIDGLVREAGFDLHQLETGHLVQGPRMLTYSYLGRAGR